MRTGINVCTDIYLCMHACIYLYVRTFSYAHAKHPKKKLHTTKKENVSLSNSRISAQKNIGKFKTKNTRTKSKEPGYQDQNKTIVKTSIKYW